VSRALAAHPVRVDSSGGLAAVDNMTGRLNDVHSLLIKAVFLLSLAFIVRQALSWRRATGVGNVAWFGVAALPVSMGGHLEVPAVRDRPDHLPELGVRGPVWVAAATLVAAALFAPVRRRVQHLVDRRFNRARYDAERTVAAFAARLQDTVDPDSVRADLAGAVHGAPEPTHVSVWLSQ